MRFSFLEQLLLSPELLWIFHILAAQLLVEPGPLHQHQNVLSYLGWILLKHGDGVDVVDDVDVYYFHVDHVDVDVVDDVDDVDDVVDVDDADDVVDVDDVNDVDVEW